MEFGPWEDPRRDQILTWLRLFPAVEGAGQVASLSRDGSAWTRPRLCRLLPQAGSPLLVRPLPGFWSLPWHCPGTATFLTLGSPGPCARAAQPSLLPGWIRQSPRTCRAGRLPGGAGAGPGAALCRAQDWAAARPCMALAGELGWQHPLAGLALPSLAPRAPNHGNQSCREPVD